MPKFTGCLKNWEQTSPAPCPDHCLWNYRSWGGMAAIRMCLWFPMQMHVPAISLHAGLITGNHVTKCKWNHITLPLLCTWGEQANYFGKVLSAEKLCPEQEIVFYFFYKNAMLQPAFRTGWIFWSLTLSMEAEVLCHSTHNGEKLI